MQLDENEISLKVERNGKEYYLVCDRESPLGEVYDVICIFKNHIIQNMQNDEEKKQSSNADEAS